MRVTRVSDAPIYDAPGHYKMTMRRLQGKEAGRTDTAWMGISELEPGGGTDPSASPVERFYVVLEGELTVEGTRKGKRYSEVLRQFDSCRIEPEELRILLNRSRAMCKVLLVMPK